MRNRIFTEGYRLIQRVYTARALLETNRHVSNAAKLLGISRRTLTHWLGRLGLRNPDQISQAAADKSVPPGVQTIKSAYEQFERAELEKALAAQQGHRSRTARALGIGRRTLQVKIRQHKLAKAREETRADKN